MSDSIYFQQGKDTFGICYTVQMGPETAGPKSGHLDVKSEIKLDSNSSYPKVGEIPDDPIYIAHPNLEVCELWTINLRSILTAPVLFGH